MDKLQKFFKGFWRYKERLFLVVMLCWLGYRVYELFVPAQLESIPPDQVGEADKPEIAPNAPPLDAQGSYYNMVHRSPFSYFSDAKLSGEKGTNPEDLGLALLDMKQVAGKWRVRLKTPGAPHKWYDEGEKFEEFQLEKINPEEKTVDIYADSIARTVTVRLQ